MELWVNALSAAVGGAVGASAVGAFIAWLAARDRFRQEADWDRRQLLREKLEAIGGLADEIECRFRGDYAQLTAAIYSQNNPSMLDVLPEVSEAIVPFGRLRLLVTFYAPELKPQLAEILRARDQYGAVLLASFPAQRPGAPADLRAKVMANIAAAGQAMEDACNALAANAAERARDRYGLTGDFDPPPEARAVGFLARWWGPRG